MVHEFIFTVDNPCSTAIYESTNPEEIIYYVDSLEDGKKFFTVVERQGQELAKLEWRDSTPDIVHIGGGILSPTRMSSWMKLSWIPFSSARSFTDVKGRKYKWKGVSPGSSMELWTPDVENEPIARFQKALPAVNDQKAQLTLGDRAMEVQDLVVISFLFLEKENRIRRQASNSRANAIAAVSSFGVNNSAQVHPGRAQRPPQPSGEVTITPKF